MKKQTAVDWLNSELERLSNQIGVNLSWAIVDDLIKQAKEIEKEQITNRKTNPMKTLQQLLIQTKTQQVTGALDKDITAIEIDSRKVKAGAVFVAIAGAQALNFFRV